MNKFLNFFTAILFLSTAILISCGGTDGDDDGDVVLEIDTKGALIASGTASATGITQDGVAVDGWDSFTLTFVYSTGTGGGTYSTTGSADDTVWPSSGSWSFAKNGEDFNTAQIERDGSTTMDLTASATQMTLGFDVVDPNGRLLTIGGKWSFSLSR